MLVLFETAAGYAIFKLLDESKIKESDDLFADFKTAESASRIVKLQHFESFTNTTEALTAATAANEGKLCKQLKKALKNVAGDVQDQLLVADAKLGNAIKDKLNMSCVSNTAVNELIRCIRSQTESLLAGVYKKDVSSMALGLAHSLSRYKLKFSPDKVDTMIVQAICLLDELDKELNNYVMRCREWYGWHFPEIGKIIADNIAYVKTVRLVGTRDNVSSTDLSDILPDEIAEKVKAAAETSMGTEIADDDIINIQELCDQVIEITSYRSQLYDYLKARMMAIAPNLTVLLGELVGARLISHAGSLLSLAKHPASTVQIIGAEKALFRALKMRKDTPKYGLIYHSQLVGQASNKNKGKMSRMLAAKAALATRVDAFCEGTPSIELGMDHRATLEKRLKELEEGNLRRISGTAKAKSKFEKYQGVSEVKQYPVAADSTIGVDHGKRKFSDAFSKSEDKKPLIEDITPTTPSSTSDDVPKKKKKKIKRESGGFDEVEVKQEVEEQHEQEEAGSSTKKKKKKKIKEEPEDEDAADDTSKGSPEKKKKKSLQTENDDDDEKAANQSLPTSEKKKKKKKKKSMPDDD